MTLAQIEQGLPDLSPSEVRKLIAKLVFINLRNDEAEWSRFQAALDDKNPESWLTLDEVKRRLREADGE
jgi:hypothetical protein